MTSGSTRRQFVAASVFVPLAIRSLPLSRDLSKQVTRDNDLVRLRLRRDILIAERNRLDEAWRRAQSVLPSWCRSGPKYRDQSGRLIGPSVGWPAARSHLIHISGTKWLVRPSPYDLRELFEADAVTKSRETAISNYRVRIAQLRIRLRERRKCYLTVGLPQTSDWEPLDLELEKVESAISSLLTGEQLVSQSGQRSSQVADHSSAHRVPHGHS